MASERAALRKAVCLPGGRRPTCYAFCPLALLGRRRSPLFPGTGDTFRERGGSAVAGPHFFTGPATLFANREALPSQVPLFSGTGDTFCKQRGSAVAGPLFFSGTGDTFCEQRGSAVAGPHFFGTGDAFREQGGSAVAGPHFFPGPATLFANGEALPSQVPTFFRDRRHFSRTGRLCRRRSPLFPGTGDTFCEQGGSAVASPTALGYYVGCRNLRRAWFGCIMGLFAPKRLELKQTGVNRAFLHPNVCGAVAEGRGFALFKNVCYLRVPCHRG